MKKEQNYQEVPQYQTVMTPEKAKELIILNSKLNELLVTFLDEKRLLEKKKFNFKRGHDYIVQMARINATSKTIEAFFEINYTENFEPDASTSFWDEVCKLKEFFAWLDKKPPCITWTYQSLKQL